MSKRFCKYLIESCTGCWAVGTAVSMLPKQSKGNTHKFVYKIFYLTCRPMLYREVHLIAVLGWVDLYLGCSTVCPIRLGLMGIWQNWLCSWARWWNIQIKSTQPRSTIRLDTLYNGRLLRPCQRDNGNDAPRRMHNVS